jgi:hypothetical protein
MGVAPSIGDGIQASDKPWDQHGPQDHHEYDGWKEHHIIYFLPRSGSWDLNLQRPAQRCAVLAPSEAMVQQAAT